MTNLKSTDYKLRGGYYTPQAIAEFLAEWAFNDHKNLKVLEPSMGDGIFIDALKKFNNKQIEFYGVELIEEEFIKAEKKSKSIDSVDFKLFNGDFFDTYMDHLRGETFNMIVGNPPFIRYQNFPKAYRENATKILNHFGFNPNKLTNAWVFFLLLSVQLLSDDGRLAMVIPAELLQVKYASESRKFLSHFFHNLTIITFKNLVFEGIQQEVVLLLGNRAPKNGKQGIDLIEVSSVEELKSIIHSIDEPSHFKSVDPKSDKWIQYLLEEKEIGLLRSIKNHPSPLLKPLGDLLDVDVGVVTGNNNFFVLNEQQVKDYNLEKLVVRLVGRSKQLNGGIIFHDKDWQEFKNKGEGIYLLNIIGEAPDYESLKKYLQLGIKEGVHEGYKCRIRKNWYSVPSIWTPQLFLLRQIHEYPRFIFNEAKAVPTDTIHRVKVFDESNAEKIATNFLNSLSFAFSEVVGRSYGGGVLELEPNEAEEIPIPFSDKKILDLEFIDKMTRKKDIEALLDYTDKELLINEIGLSTSEVSSLRKIWRKLSNRRINRKSVN